MEKSNKDYLKALIPKSLRDEIREVINSYRLMTSQYRSLPDFLIIGAQKSGTSSLFHYLSQHPHIVPCFGKEVHYFDGGIFPEKDNYINGVSWYRSNFPLRLNFYKLTGEATPMYLFHPYAAKRIYQLIPEVKLIAILRNPTERAISHYYHEKRSGKEKRRLIDALLEEDELLEKNFSDSNFRNYEFYHHTYKSRGIYYKQLERYLKFFPRKQMLILSSEELLVNTETILRKVFEFLGVERDCKIKDLSQRNVGIKRGVIDQVVFKYLDSYFKPYNQKLFKLINRKFNW